MIVVGIDPGFSGGIAYLNTENLLKVHYFKMPVRKNKDTGKRDLDIKGLRLLFERIDWDYGDENVKVVIENVHAFPKQGAVSNFRFGEQLGVLKALCEAFAEPKLLSPQKWKRFFGLIGKPKSAAVDYVNNFFGLSLRPTQDGVADAILIGLYATKNMKEDE